MQSQPVINSSQLELMRFASSELLKNDNSLARKPSESARRAHFRLDTEGLVEVNGIEPMTSCLQSRRSPN